ncbi:MAG: glycoside hydrolase family 3 C-terminal domain-containing protein [Oscillospiraceae bacterium]|jgi:beta-glucosidase|nr:glycoside hydrolase family 3 C-terminal domain-containing protein [Oscillospiraceae bacterium]
MAQYTIAGRTVPEILAQLTLEEKAAFLDGRDFWHLESLERLGIPAVMVCDGPHGLRQQLGAGDQLGFGSSTPATCFPTASLTACSWDADLLEQMGIALGEEARADGVSVVLGPGVNMKRSPLCGRNFEYFSEDPHLAGELGAAWVRGVQSQGVGTSLKHFCANNQETRRLYVDTVVDERALRELYLPAFETIVKREQPWTVMNSYNKINGTFASQNAYTQWQILREEWGFDGIVVSDWGAVTDRVEGVRAGNDLEMPSTFGLRTKEIIDAVNAGTLDERVVDTRVTKLLELIAKCIPNLEAQATSTYSKPKHHALARKIAGESMVLLKNDGVLPLQSGARIAVIGEMAKAPRYQGAGSSQINPHTLDSFCGVLDAAGAEYTYAQGYEKKPGKKYDPASYLPDAVAAAQGADVVLLFIGLTEAYESEGFDRTHLELPEAHNQLADAVLAANPNTVVVLSGGAPAILPWFARTPAVLNAYLHGSAGAGAIWDILSGEVNPSGKLAETYPLALADTPAADQFPGGLLSVEYRESLYIGYRYYDKVQKPVLLPFGFGLSYTSFAYSDLRLSADSITDSDSLKATLTVTNTGAVDGKEIVQLYVANDGQSFRAPRELKAFAKVALKAGESQEITLTLDKRAFALWDTTAKDWRVPSGTYTIQVGASSADIRLTAPVTVRSAAEPAAVDVPAVYRTGDPAKVSAADFVSLLGHALPPSDRAPDAVFTIEDTFELARNTKWGGRVYRTAARITSRLEGGGMIFAEATTRPFHDLIYMSAGLFTPDMASGLLQVLNGQRAGQGAWKLLRGLPHLLLNVGKLTKMAF